MTSLEAEILTALQSCDRLMKLHSSALMERDQLRERLAEEEDFTAALLRPEVDAFGPDLPSSSADATPSIVFWDCDESAEYLDWTSRNAAIGAHLESLIRPNMTVTEVLAALPEEIKVHGYARREWSPADCGDPLKDVLQRLDAEYGNPDEETKPTEAMMDASRVFLDVVCGGYKGWSCEVIHTEPVIVREWIEQHRPDWINGEA